MSLQSIFATLLPFVNTDEIPLTFDIYYTLETGESVNVGSTVKIDTLCYGPQQDGIITAIVENPYYGQFGLCAYIIAANGDGWTEYLPVELEVYE